MSDKIALISGVTGHDGALLAEFLLGKGYVVHGVKRRSSSLNTARIDHLYEDLHDRNVRFRLHYGDMTDTSNIISIVQETCPDEIYNLAAQSHVKVSFETPEYTANADALGTLRMLEAIRILKMSGPRASIRRRLPSSSVLVQTVPRTNRRPSIRARPTLSPSSMPIGSRLTTAKPMAFMRRMAFSSTTRARFAARPS